MTLNFAGIPILFANSFKKKGAVRLILRLGTERAAAVTVFKLKLARPSSQKTPPNSQAFFPSDTSRINQFTITLFQLQKAHFSQLHRRFAACANKE